MDYEATAQALMAGWGAQYPGEASKLSEAGRRALLEGVAQALEDGYQAAATEVLLAAGTSDPELAGALTRLAALHPAECNCRLCQDHALCRAAILKQNPRVFGPTA